MRPTQIINLPKSGFSAEVITYWSWSEKQEMTRTLLGDTTIDPQNGSVGEVSAVNGLDLNRKSLTMGVKKLTDNEGKEVALSELFDLPESDVDIVLNAIRAIDENLKKN